MRQFSPQLAQQLGVQVSRDTLRRLAKRLGYSWKRMRRSLRAQRAPVLFAFFQQQLALLHQAEARGEVAVYDGDECRFSRLAPVPYAWQVRGQPPVELPAERGASGWSVLGLWQAKGVGQPLACWRLAGALTAPVFVAALEEWVATLTPPTVLVLDNASIHRAHLVQQRLPAWREKGLQIPFIPAYCPELNRIETLWHHGKHLWLTPADYASEDTLRQAIDQLLKRVGTHYQITSA